MIKGGLRRGGLTPALDPRLPVTTEDDRRQIEAVNATAVLPRGTYIKNESCLSEEQKKTLDSMNQKQILPSGTKCISQLQP